MDEVSATVLVLGRKYKLYVPRSSEANLRKAAELINSQAEEYGRVYAYKDQQDLLSMVALTQVTRLLETQDNKQFRDNQLLQRLQQIDKLLTPDSDTPDAQE